MGNAASARQAGVAPLRSVERGDRVVAGLAL